MSSNGLRWKMDLSGALLVLVSVSAASLPILLQIWRKRRARHPPLQDTVSDEELRNFNLVVVPLDIIDVFQHQVAGHTKEILRSFRGCILKPMIKIKHFFRELVIYEKMESHGSHWTQSAKAFVAGYHGLIIANGAASTPHAPSSYSFSSSSSSSCPAQLLNIKNTDRLFLALKDQTQGYAEPCAIDIKMGTQTFEPDASPAKKEREGLKCKYQAEVGFRITGFKVFDSAHGTYVSVGKEFGRRLAPEQVTDGLALFFFDGLCLRRSVIQAAIQKLERLLLWMKSQNSLHFYCSSILIVYDGGSGSAPSSSSSASSASSSSSSPSSPSHTIAPDRLHYLHRLGPAFPPVGPDLAAAIRQKDQGGAASPLRPPNPAPPPTDKELQARAQALVTERAERIRLKRRHEARRGVAVDGLVHVAIIDFAHALPGTGGVDAGYLHGLHSLISRLRLVLHGGDGRPLAALCA